MDENAEQSKAKIRTRLRRVCSHLSEEDFESLVAKVLYQELKPRSTLWPQLEQRTVSKPDTSAESRE
jgi:hypothetical protein